MSQPAILELPYANNSFFQLLLDKLKPDDIITIFTVMMLEKKILLIAPKEEQLLPLSFALHSLIYPFKYCIFVPQLERKDIQMLNIPLGVFFGIVKSDEPSAMEVIEDDVENKPVLFIEVFDEEP